MLDSDDLFELICGDAIEELRKLPDESVDLLITDPAYSSLEKHRKKGTTTRLKVSDGSSNPWFPVVPDSYFPEFLAECYRVLARNAHAYIFTDNHTKYVIHPIATAGIPKPFTFWNEIQWIKPRLGMGYHYRRKHECVMFFEKGKRKLHDLGIPDVLPRKDETFEPPEEGYPTEKPWELAKIFTEQSSEPGQIVLDPFCGSSSTGKGALLAGRRYLGIDVTQAAMIASGNKLARLKIAG